MSDERRHETLDALIDEAARQLTSSAAPEGLRGRVLARIGAREPRPGLWLVPVGATALTLVALVSSWTRSPYLPASDQVADTVSVAPAVGPTDRTAPGGANAPVAAAAPATSSGAVVQMTAPPGTPDLEARGESPDLALVESMPPEGIEPIVLAHQLLEPLSAEDLTPMVSVDPEPIPMESIQLAALGSQEGDL